jgi:cell division inhibitor SulA/protein ImuA
MPTPDPTLARLLEHPAIWRGRNAARGDTIGTGYEVLDSGLPGGGWPRTGLVEILTPHHGVGELELLMPTLARLSTVSPPRWLTWVAPPFLPYAPALLAHGLVLERQLVVHSETALWAMELALGCGACAAALAWVRRAQSCSLRRLQLASASGGTLGFLFRNLSAARESSPAVLRLAVQPLPQGVRVTLLKSRGGTRTPLELTFPERGGS